MKDNKQQTPATDDSAVVAAAMEVRRAWGDPRQLDGPIDDAVDALFATLATHDAQQQAPVAPVDGRHKWQGLEMFIARQRKWSLRTFGDGPRTNGLIEHIKEELDEIAAAPTDLSEWVDVLTLALDGASRAGHSPIQIARGMQEKQNVNMFDREWPKYEAAWKRAFKKLWDINHGTLTKQGKVRSIDKQGWSGWQDYWDWWMSGESK